jgi:hypothetical protein
MRPAAGSITRIGPLSVTSAASSITGQTAIGLSSAGRREAARLGLGVAEISQQTEASLADNSEEFSFQHVLRQELLLLIRAKQQEYRRSARIYSIIYYSTRLCLGLSAGMLPFVLRVSVSFSTALAILIVTATVVDSSFSLRERSSVFSRASRLLDEAIVRTSVPGGQANEAWASLELEASQVDNMTGVRSVLQRIRSSV